MSSGPSPLPAPAQHLCKTCGSQLDPAWTLHQQDCMDCKNRFCSRCLVQMGLGPRLCHTCQRLRCTFFERAQLMRLKVRHLRDYLHLHQTPTQMCREKEELVELVLAQQATQCCATAESRPQPPALPVPDHSLTQSELTEEQDEDDEDEETEGDEQDGDEGEEEDEEESTDSEENLVHSRRASLSDLSSVEDIESLSVRQLKEILARNFVNYQGCCEKWELMEKVTHLFNDQKDLHDLVSNTKTEAAEPAEPGGQEENLCKICMDLPIDCVLLECGHMVTCSKCGQRMKECPICRQYVVRAVHVFRS